MKTMKKLFLSLGLCGLMWPIALTAQADLNSVAAQIERDPALARDLTSFHVAENTDQAISLVSGLTERFPRLVCSITRGAIDGYPDIDDEMVAAIIQAAVEAQPESAEGLAQCLVEAYPDREVLIRTTIAETLENLPETGPVQPIDTNLPDTGVDPELGPTLITPPTPTPAPPPATTPPGTTAPVPPAPVPSPN